MFKFIAMTVGVFALLVVLAVAFGVFEAGYNRTVGVAIDNSRTDRTRQSNQYVDSIQSELSMLHRAYLAAADGSPHRAAIVASMHEEASKLTADNIPPAIAAFLVTHPLGSN